MKALATFFLSVIGLHLFAGRCSAEAASLKVCNQGDTRISVILVYYRSSIFFGQSWVVNGWTNIGVGSCNYVYDASNFDGAYLGFVYTDGKGTTGAYRPSISNRKEWLKALAPPTNFCVKLEAYKEDYTTTAGSLTDCSRSVGLLPLPFYVYFDSGNGGNYELDLSPELSDTAIPLAPVAKTQAQEDAESEATQLKLVREHVLDYIAAAPSGFEKYRKTDPPPKVVNGNRIWPAVKPYLLDSCSIVEQPAKKVFTCVMDKPAANRASAVDVYNKLVDRVRKSLPSGWTELKDPPYKSEEASVAFMSATVEGEIWIHYDSGSSTYSVQFQVLPR